VKKIGIVINRKRPHAAHVLDALARKAETRGFELCMEAEADIEHPDIPARPAAEMIQHAEVLLALGGDGTVLHTARLLNGAPLPILGLNLGSLGFLTSVSEEELDAALDALRDQTCTQSVRTVAGCTLQPGGEKPIRLRALNDAVIGWGGSSHIVHLSLCIDGEQTALFQCDGIIVTTPTGSTGHALSAGGPILHPGSGVFGISLICPHTLSSRPLVIPDQKRIDIKVLRTRKALVCSIDGQDICTQVRAGFKLTVQRSEQPVVFLHPPGHSYFKTLSRKLHWRGSNLS
jgi:NAD+ kinase